MSVISFRFAINFGNNDIDVSSIEDLRRPDPEQHPCNYTDFLLENNWGILERLALILALAPHLDPTITELFLQKSSESENGSSEFGAIKVGNSPIVIPTGQTLAFLYAGKDLDLRMKIISLFEPLHLITKLHLIELGSVSPGESMLIGILKANQDLLDLVYSDKPKIPKFGQEFPAKVLTSRLEWEDLVLDGQIFKQLEEIMTWLKFHTILQNEWDMKRHFKPGYRALFYGPPGTGKTMCATLLGKYAKQEVLRIDLSMVVSKYIGETEKNLSKIFDAAERKNWILFFDEADALFGKRTKVQDSHDRYANQEVSYLLQRVEEYEGLVLLATNLRSNMDDAFTRRFQTVVYFPLPRIEERIEIWKRTIPAAAELAPEIDLNQIAADYELSGGAIVNAVHYACLQTAKEGSKMITGRTLKEAIRREYHKEGKTM